MNSDDSRRGNDTRYRPVGMGHGDSRTLAMCGHKSRIGKRIGNVLVRCAECEAKRQQEQA